MFYLFVVISSGFPNDSKPVYHTVAEEVENICNKKRGSPKACVIYVKLCVAAVIRRQWCDIGSDARNTDIQNYRCIICNGIMYSKIPC